MRLLLVMRCSIELMDLLLPESLESPPRLLGLCAFLGPCVGGLVAVLPVVFNELSKGLRDDLCVGESHPEIH